MTTPHSIGFVGLGIMGRPMALNLLQAGYHLRVHTRRIETAQPLINRGALYFDTPKQAAQEADTIITVVSDTPDVEQVVLGAQGVIHGARPGTVVVDMSTISPGATRKIAMRLRQAGVDMLDAPVSGGEQGAVEGTLSIMVGGSESVFERVRPFLECMGRHITYLGDHGAGQVAKACNQILVAQSMVAVAEAFQLATSCGVDPAKVRQALLGGFAYSKCLETHGRKMLDHDFEPGFKARLHHKDMGIALQTAAETGTQLPGSSLAAQYLNQLVESGGGELDSSAIATMIDPR